MHVATSSAFKENAHHALANAGLQSALARSGSSFIARRAAAVAALPEWKSCATPPATSRTTPWRNLDFYLEAYEAKVLESGGKVHSSPTQVTPGRRVLRFVRRERPHRHQGQIDDRRGNRDQ